MPLTSSCKIPLYWPWIQSECILIKSDGCSGVPDFYKACCEQHDLAYYYARDPRSAYRNYINDNELSELYWLNATPFTKSQADKQFRSCVQDKSPWKNFSPMSWWRWLGVKWFGAGAWKKHRERERLALIEQGNEG